MPMVMEPQASCSNGSQLDDSIRSNNSTVTTDAHCSNASKNTSSHTSIPNNDAIENLTLKQVGHQEHNNNNNNNNGESNSINSNCVNTNSNNATESSYSQHDKRKSSAKDEEKATARAINEKGTATSQELSVSSFCSLLLVMR